MDGKVLILKGVVWLVRCANKALRAVVRMVNYAYALIQPQGDVAALPPVANFVARPNIGSMPLKVTFNDLSEGDEISTWSWDFGDGNWSTEQNPVHTYAGEGSYDVTLTVTNPWGSNTVTQVAAVIVTEGGEFPASLTADFGMSHMSGGQPVTVSFADKSRGSPTSWAWTFGDGTTSTQQNPSHTYNDVGTYTVSLTVSDGTDSHTVTYANMVEVVESSGGGDWQDQVPPDYWDFLIRYPQPTGVTNYTWSGTSAPFTLTLNVQNKEYWFDPKSTFPNTRVFVAYPHITLDCNNNRNIKQIIGHCAKLKNVNIDVTDSEAIIDHNCNYAVIQRGEFLGGSPRIRVTITTRPVDAVLVSALFGNLTDCDFSLYVSSPTNVSAMSSTIITRVESNAVISGGKFTLRPNRSGYFVVAMNGKMSGGEVYIYEHSDMCFFWDVNSGANISGGRFVTDRNSSLGPFNGVHMLHVRGIISGGEFYFTSSNISGSGSPCYFIRTLRGILTGAQFSSQNCNINPGVVIPSQTPSGGEFIMFGGLMRGETVPFPGASGTPYQGTFSFSHRGVNYQSTNTTVYTLGGATFYVVNSFSQV